MLPFPEATLYRGVAAVAEDRPDSVALHDGAARWTYEDLVAGSRAFAGGLADLGVGAGDTVAVWLANRTEWVLTQLAASYLGASVVAVNTRYRTHELEYMLRDADCRVLVTERSFLDNEYLEMLSEVVPAVRDTDPDAFDPDDLALAEVVTVDDTPEFDAIRRFDDVVGAGEPPEEPFDDPGAPVAIFYTSGTTGDPKGCLHASRSVLNHSANGAAHLGIDAGDVVLGALPFPGVWGYNTWLGALARGATLVVQSHFDPEETARLVADHEVTAMSGMAAMFTRTIDTVGESWAASLERGVICFLTLSYDPDTFERVEETVGFPLVQPYGLSEGNSQVFVGDPAAPLAERKRVGGPLVADEQDARIVDPGTGDPVPAGEKGELQLRGYNLMEGYLGMPEATAAAFDDGWLRTGDLCSRVGEALVFHARIDDALRVRGFLVTPREIETAIDDVAGVAQSKVVGVSHERHGQVPVAFVRRADESLSTVALERALADAVADYKVPEEFVFVASFPRTEGPHGEKVRKHELRDRAADIVS